MAKVYQFDDFVLDHEAYELRRESALVPVEPLVLDLLALLLEKPGVVMGRDALMEQIWQGRIVSDTTISTAIKSARKALGDTGHDQKCIRTVRGRGIHWVRPLESEKLLSAESNHSSADASEQLALYVRCSEVTDDPAMIPLVRAMRLRTRRYYRAFRCCE